MQLKRTAVTAIVIAVAVAPNAPAMPVRDPGTLSAEPHNIKPTQHSTRFEEMASLRRALREREWTPAQSTPVVTVAPDADDGFDWRSALIGAVVSLALFLAAMAARPAITRRRDRTSALA